MRSRIETLTALETGIIAASDFCVANEYQGYPCSTCPEHSVADRDERCTRDGDTNDPEREHCSDDAAQHDVDGGECQQTGRNGKGGDEADPWGWPQALAIRLHGTIRPCISLDACRELSMC